MVMKMAIIMVVVMVMVMVMELVNKSHSQNTCFLCTQSVCFTMNGYNTQKCAILGETRITFSHSQTRFRRLNEVLKCVYCK